MSYFKIYTDGGSRGNPGDAGIGLVIYDGDTGETVWELGDYLGKATNNVAEYTALVRALEIAGQLGGTKLEVYADSELMIKQLKGEYKVKNEGLIPLYQQVRRLAASFPSCTYTHVLRAANKRADAMANLAMDKKARVGGGVKTTPVKEERCVKGQGKTGEIGEIAFAYASQYPPKGELVLLAPGIYRENVAVGSQMMMVRVYLAKGSTLPMHKHVAEQISFVLSGKLIFRTSEGDTLVKQGQSMVFQSNQEHGGTVLEDTIVLDSFVPLREDFLNNRGK